MLQCWHRLQALGHIELPMMATVQATRESTMSFPDEKRANCGKAPVHRIGRCRFQWTENAIAVWDNRCVLHHALWDYWPQDREGHRVSVVGEKPEMWRLGEDREPEQVARVRLTA